MPRTKSYTRESLLKKAIPLFLRQGYTGTSVQDLEQATGITKSSLYAEFENKEALYSACIDYFAEFKSARETLLSEPYGWSNVEAFLSFFAEYERKAENGCLLVNSMREHNSLPEALRVQNEAYFEAMRRLLVQNISAEKTKLNAEAIANVVLRLFAGAALLQNVAGLEKSKRPQSVAIIMTMLRSL